MRFINKKNKKCKKGWVKATWNSPGPSGPLGPQGPVGPAGPTWTVKDSSGQALGTFVGVLGAGLLGYTHVMADDGGVFLYRNDGLLVNDNAALFFVNNGCTDAAIYDPTSPGLDVYLKSAGTSGRAVFQVTNAPTASAWKIAETTTTTVPVPANSLFKKNPTTGACASAAHAGGFIVPLTPVDAPKVAAGSLRLVR